MLIKRRLEIPGDGSDNPMHWWFGATLILALVIAAVQDTGKEHFGLDTAESLTEVVSVSFVIVLIVGIEAIGLFGVGLLANWNAGRIALMAGLAFVPLACFLGYAHCEMSHALMWQKLEFKKRAMALQQKRAQKCAGPGCGPVDLEDVLRERNETLGRYGYVHIGGWRTGGGDPDCSSVYLFTAGLFTERPTKVTVSQNTSRGAF